MLLRIAVLGVVVIALSWLLMVVLAKRLPPGWAKDAATVLPASATTIRRLRRDARVPRSAKVAILIAGLWVLSPIDLIPEFLPVIGPLDDVVVVALALRFAARRVPREAIEEAWPADPALLARLLRPRRADERAVYDRPMDPETAHDEADARSTIVHRCADGPFSVDDARTALIEAGVAAVADDVLPILAVLEERQVIVRLGGEPARWELVID